jgi:hypothetical protein
MAKPSLFRKLSAVATSPWLWASVLKLLIFFSGFVGYLSYRVFCRVLFATTTCSQLVFKFVVSFALFPIGIAFPNAAKKSARSRRNAPRENITMPSDPSEAVIRIMKCDEEDFYGILAASSECAQDDLKKLFRRQSLLVHPDKNTHKVRNAMHLTVTEC